MIFLFGIRNVIRPQLDAELLLAGVLSIPLNRLHIYCINNTLTEKQKSTLEI